MLKEKNLNQWFFKITKFSKELLESLDTLKDWPNKVKVMQKNWIGKSYGVKLNLKLIKKEIKEIKCYTTRPDTLFGMSFLALSVDHPLQNFMKMIQNLLNLKKNVLKQDNRRVYCSS